MSTHRRPCERPTALLLPSRSHSRTHFHVTSRSRSGKLRLSTRFVPSSEMEVMANLIVEIEQMRSCSLPVTDPALSAGASTIRKKPCSKTLASNQNLPLPFLS